VEPIRNIRLDQYYTVRTCPGRSLEISVTPPPPVTGTDGRPVRFPEFGPEFLYQDVERLSPDKDTLDYVRRMRYGGELSLIGDGGELHVCVRNCLQVSHSLSVLAVTRLFGLTWRWSAFEQEFRRRNDDDGPQIMVAEDASDARTQWSADSPARYPDARYTITIALGPPQ
jgi:hypothetical protein